MISPLFARPADPLVAYFSAEFAISDDLPIYSGGLGVLAGDIVRQAADDELPMVAVGLFYQQGYFEQGVDAKGRQQHIFEEVDPKKGGLRLLTDIHNQPVVVSVPYHSSRLFAQVWQLDVGSVRMFFMDTNTDLNPERWRTITQHLYPADRTVRLAQEMLLGIGGVKLLRLLDLYPPILHLNEGHSAFAVFELAWEIRDSQQLPFDEALRKAGHSIVFTNHTIVAAGNDAFPRHMVSDQLSTYAEDQDLPLAQLLDFGQDDEAENTFSMTILALNAARIANTVSKIHNQAARTVWPNYTFASVTNAVHLPTWVSDSLQQKAGQLNEAGLDSLSDAQIWQLHQANKQKLLDLVKKTTGVTLKKDVLTVVWARRFAAYKRPGLIFQDLECLRMLSEKGKLQVIFAGKAHPNDKIGQGVFEEIHRLTRLHGLEDSIVLMPNYKMGMAKMLECGADIWLNTPIRGQEASGTSGMKAGANGALHISTSDGWMDEVNWRNIAWILPDDNTADELFELLKHEVVPTYEECIAKPENSQWLQRMRQTMRISWTQFSGQRMLREYRQILYQPILKSDQ